MHNLAEQITAARNQIFFQHNPQNTDGFITIARKESGVFRQYFYKPPELASHLTNVIGEDVFFSQNTFYRKSRRIETIRQLRSLYVDLDCYIFNFTPDQVLYWLEEEYFNRTIPEPNMIIFSGQGIVLIWTIEPVPYKALPLWQAIQNYLLSQVKNLGGDAKATDAARIFRLAGSISSKNGSEVHVEYRHDYRYTLREIQDEYLPELKPKKEATKGRKKKVVHLFNVYTLNNARLHDLSTLVSLRKGEMDGYREITLFLYRYWTCCFTQDPAEALSQTLEFNQTFSNPLQQREAERATKSAEKAYLAKSDKEANERAKAMGYPGAGYKLSNTKLIEWLDISEWEQQFLKTIIDTKEKNRRRREEYKKNPEKKIQQVTKRNREKGMRPMAEYNKERLNSKLNKAEILKALIAENPKATNAKLAEIMNCSIATIKRLKQHL